MKGCNPQLIMREQHSKRASKRILIGVCVSTSQSRGTTMMAIGYVDNRIFEERLDALGL